MDVVGAEKCLEVDEQGEILVLARVADRARAVVGAGVRAKAVVSGSYHLHFRRRSAIIMAEVYYDNAHSKTGHKGLPCLWQAI